MLCTPIHPGVWHYVYSVWGCLTLRQVSAVAGEPTHRHRGGQFIIYFASAAVAVDSSHVSSASWSRFSPPSNVVIGHMSTVWFMVCRWPLITGRWFVQGSTTWALTCPETVHRRPCMTKDGLVYYAVCPPLTSWVDNTWRSKVNLLKTGQRSEAQIRGNLHPRLIADGHCSNH